MLEVGVAVGIVLKHIGEGGEGVVEEKFLMLVICKRIPDGTDIRFVYKFRYRRVKICQWGGVVLLIPYDYSQNNSPIINQSDWPTRSNHHDIHNDRQKSMDPEFIFVIADKTPLLSAAMIPFLGLYLDSTAPHTIASRDQ